MVKTDSIETLRLRLVVRRHGLPEFKLLFPVGLANDPTIANLLEQINETAPLESDGQWSLEDYVVEIKDPHGEAFELLHYQQVSSILKNDETVYIRPLLSDDFKKRRASGRHQISKDGKRLFDGIAFGRPRLRIPHNRPPIDIPPRKRTRLVFEEEEDAEPNTPEKRPRLLTEDNHSRSVDFEDVEDHASVKLLADFVNDDSDSDEDFESVNDGELDEMELDDGDDDLAQELLDLRKENGDVQEDDQAEDEPAEDEHNEKEHAEDNAYASNTLSLSTLDDIIVLREAFPTASVDECERLVLAHNHNIKKVYKKLRKSHAPQSGIQAMLERRVAIAKPAVLEQSEEEEEVDESATKLIEYFDSHGFPPGSLDNGTAASHAAEVASRNQPPSSSRSPSPPTSSPSITNRGLKSSPLGSTPVEAAAEPADTTSEDESSSSVSEESDTEDDSSSADDSDDDGPEVASSKPKPAILPSLSKTDDSSSDTSSSDEDSGEGDDASSETSSEDDSESDDDESSSSDDGSESGTDSDSDSGSGKGVVSASRDSGGRPAHQMVDPSKSTTTSTSVSDIQTSRPSLTETENRHEAAVLTTKPMTKTQKRNARKREAKKLKEAAALAQNSHAAMPVEGDAEFLARKQALLNAIGESPAASALPESILTTSDRSAPPAAYVGTSQNTTTVNPSPDGSIETQRRLRLDMGAGRRLLFSALGLKNPKSKADEDKIRADLMKNVRPLINPRILEDNAQDNHEVPDDDPEAWRDKITYRAVECCQEGIQLSEPPFPFVQRWDPQQQSLVYDKKNKRGGKRKRAQRNQYDYYEGDLSGKKARFAEDTNNGDMDDAWDVWDDSYYADGADNTNVAELNYDDAEAPQHEDPSILKDADDLPSLPQDTSNLSDLRPGEAKAGMVITWKQWLLSKATNWQPQLLSLTAVIVNIDNDATSVQVLLAKRDRYLDRNEKEFDEETGQRIYSKFEAPDLSDDDEVEDEESEESGYRTLAFSDMMEPKILQQPAEIPTVDSQNNAPAVSAGGPVRREESSGSADANSTSHGEKSTTLDHENEDEALPAAESRGVDGGSNEESIIPETNLEQTPDATGAQPAQLGSNPDMSITEERRHEISRMIADASFRKGIPSPVNQNDVRDMDEEMGQDSPSRQLEDTSEAAIASRQTSRNSSPVRDGEPSPPLSIPAAMSSNEKDVSTAQPTPKAVYPQLDVPESTASSIQSGRQPDPDFSVDLGNDSFPPFEDTGDSAAQQEGAPKVKVASTPAQSPPDSAEPRSSSSPFPAVEDVFSTALTSRNTQSPFKSRTMSAMKARNLVVERDLEYEEAMRKLDEEDEEDEEDEADAARVQKDPASWSTSKLGTLNRSDASRSKDSHSPGDVKPTLSQLDAPRPARQSQSQSKSQSQFSVPGGSQVISLLSSSPELDLEETYADDSIDADYLAPKKSLPTGDGGWVQKNKDGVKTNKRRSLRGASLPASRAVAGSKVRAAPSASQVDSRMSVPAPDFVPVVAQRRKKISSRS